MRTPTRRAIVAVLAASLAVIAMISPVAAGASQQVTLVSTTIFHQNVPNDGTFVASGPAVDNHVICDTGTFVDTGIKFAGFQSGKAVQITVDKAYSCPDGSFFVKMQIHANFDGTEKFSWVITGGTGPYSALHGSGQGTTVPNDDGNVNTFVGHLLH